MNAPTDESVPAPLLIAAGLVLIQGIATVIYGAGELVHLTSDRLVMGLTTAAFFLGYGAGLAACAWGLRRAHRWARGPVLLAQLIWLGLAWGFRHGDTLVIALVLAVPALVVLAGLLHPRSIEALER